MAEQRGVISRSVSAREAIATQRLAAQHIAAPARADPGEVVAYLGAVQAQDYAATKWAVGLRLGGSATERDLERALAHGSVLRTHALRLTWQLVAPKDIRWLLDLVRPRLTARFARRHRELGLDATILRRSHALLVKTLADGTHRTRDELAAALASGDIASDGQRLSYLLAHAEIQGLVCSGAPRGAKQTYALLDQRAPVAAQPISRDQALAQLALRYFQSRGPATLRDFVWWSGLSVAEARTGLASVSAQLTSNVAGEHTYYRAGELPRTTKPHDAHLLPAFDEFLVAYRDREAVLDRKHVRQHNAGGGMLDPCVVLGGRVVGTWRRVIGRDRVEVQVRTFSRATVEERRKITAAAKRYGEFLGQQTRVSFQEVVG